MQSTRNASPSIRSKTPNLLAARRSEPSFVGNGDDDVAKEEEQATVAIKQFKGLTDMEDEHTRKYVRLTQEREAELALSLLHPNIVRCLGTLTAREGRQDDASSASSGGGGGDGVAFLIFEHVPGTLLDLIQERPGGLSLPEVRWRSANLGRYFGRRLPL